MDKHQSNIPYEFLGDVFPGNLQSMDFRAEAAQTSNTVVPTVDKDFYNDFGDLFAEDGAADGEKKS